MEDRDFFDYLYQQWSKTTGAKDRYWMPVEYDDPSGRHRIYAVDEKDSRKLIAEGLSEADADFITAVHGCLPDLIRHLGESADEAERADTEKDNTVVELAELALENQELTRKLDEANARLQDLEDR